MIEEIEEIGEILDNAEEEWKLAEDNNSDDKFKSAEKLFLLAIKKAKTIYPEVHARLSELYLSMCLHFNKKGDEKKMYLLKESAEEQADVALKQDPENINAQFVKSWIYFIDIDVNGKFLLAGLFKKEVEKLISLYQNLVLENKIDAEEVFFWGDRLMFLVEMIEKKKLFGKNEIYLVISNIEVSNLDYSDVEPERLEILKKDICSLKFKAESQLL